MSLSLANGVWQVYRLAYGASFFCCFYPIYYTEVHIQSSLHTPQSYQKKTYKGDFDLGMLSGWLALRSCWDSKPLLPKSLGPAFMRSGNLPVSAIEAGVLVST